MSAKYILDGHDPVEEPDVFKWCAWFERTDRHVAKTRVNGVYISTIFLGLDHQFGNGAPLLFETMTFAEDGAPIGFDQTICERCSTWEQAEAQHERVCAMVREAK